MEMAEKQTTWRYQARVESRVGSDSTKGCEIGGQRSGARADGDGATGLGLMRCVRKFCKVTASPLPLLRHCENLDGYDGATGGIAQRGRAALPPHYGATPSGRASGFHALRTEPQPAYSLLRSRVYRHSRAASSIFANSLSCTYNWHLIFGSPQYARARPPDDVSHLDAAVRSATDAVTEDERVKTSALEALEATISGVGGSGGGSYSISCLFLLLHTQGDLTTFWPYARCEAGVIRRRTLAGRRREAARITGRGPPTVKDHLW